MRRSVLVGLIVGCLITTTGAAAACPGELDEGFGKDGRVLLKLGRLVQARDVLVLRHQKVLAVGVSDGDFVVTRLKSNGRPHKKFGGNGQVTTRFADPAEVSRVIKLPQRRILVAGSTYAGAFALVRYRHNGTRDSSFGKNGKVVTRLDAPDVALDDVMVDGAGRIVAAGRVGERFVTVRYLPSGQLDTSFADEGVQFTEDSLPVRDINPTVRLQSNGRLVVVGTAVSQDDDDDDDDNRQFFVARFDHQGRLDASFAGGWTTIGDPTRDFSAHTALVQPNGRILVAGDAMNPRGGSDLSALARLLPDGTPDDSFGDDGVVTQKFKKLSGAINGVSLQGDGSILATGTGTGSFTLARYGADGRIDDDFAQRGITATTFSPSSNGSADGLAVASRGRRIVVVGGHYTGHRTAYDGDFAIARFHKR